MSVLISLIVLSGSIAHFGHDPQYTIDSPAVVTNNGVYFAENWNDEGHIYLVDSSGNVKYMAVGEAATGGGIRGLCIAEGNVYAIFSIFAFDDKDEVVQKCKIYKMSPSLKISGETGYFAIDSAENVRYLSYDSGILYITTVDDDGKAVNVYTESAEEIVSGGSTVKVAGISDDDDEELTKPEVFLFRNDSGGSIFTDAYYEDGALNVLTDREVPSGGFLPDARVRNAVDNIHFTVFQNMSLYSKFISGWLICLIIWFAIIIAVYLALKNKNRMVYVFITSEFVLFIIAILGFGMVRSHFSKVAKDENARYASLVVDYELNDLGDLRKYNMEEADFLTSEEYGKLRKELVSFMGDGKNEGFFYDVFVMRIKDGRIMAAASGRNMADAVFIHGDSMAEIRESLSIDHRSAFAEADFDGIKMEAVGVANEDPTAPYGLVGVYYSGSYYTGLWADFSWVFIAFLLTFLAGSAIIAFVMFLQNLDLREFEIAIRDVALGRRKINTPNTPAQDMRAMWASLGELEKKIEEINYDKYRIFEGYYRFAPKNIETIMGKESIFDVNNGDTTNTEGSLMLVSTERSDYGEKRIHSLKNIVSYMGQYSDREDGILVSEDSSLSTLQFLFLQDMTSVAAQATQFIHRNSSDEDSGFVSVFLYYGNFMYGVVGVNTQSLVFLTSPHSREMETYASWFVDMKLPLVVTEDIVRREAVGESRYIGYIVLKAEDEEEEEDRLKIYEILDACDAKTRQIKLSNREKFEDTLELFYSKDFYLARNNFSEVLKDCPDDSMAKWYLFECERYLNGDADMEESGPLRITE